MRQAAVRRRGTARSESDDRVAAMLVARYQAGDVQGFVALHERFEPRIYAYLRKRTGSRQDAEDLTQKVFLRVFEALPIYSSARRPFSGWLWRITHNVLIDDHRRHVHAAAIAPGDLIDQLDSAFQEPDLEPPGWDSVPLSLAMAEATPIHRQILALFYLHDLSAEQVGALVGRTPAAVDKLRRRALARVRVRLETPPAT